MTATWEDFREQNRQALEALPECACCHVRLYAGEGHRTKRYIYCVPCSKHCAICTTCQKNQYGPDPQEPESVSRNQARMDL